MSNDIKTVQLYVDIHAFSTGAYVVSVIKFSFQFHLIAIMLDMTVLIATPSFFKLIVQVCSHLPTRTGLVVAGHLEVEWSRTNE